MTHSSASGERNALRGYRWQYDQLAAEAYDALREDDFVSLRLVDPEAGQVDDLVLERSDRTVGYQFKSREYQGALSFSKLLASRQNRGGTEIPSLLRALAIGWKALGAPETPIEVHLSTNQWPSLHDHLSEPGRPSSPDHFAAFSRDVLEPIQSGVVEVSDVADRWLHALQRMRDEAGLDAEEFRLFLKALTLDFARGDALASPLASRRADLRELSDALYRLVSNSSAVVVLDRQQILELVGWSDRVNLRSQHEFPVDLDRYEPLEGATRALAELIDRTTQGYLALVGPPGSGKSTLVSQSLTGNTDRLVRYYAYVPGRPATRSRLEGSGFLHDVVLLLDRAGLRTSHQLIERTSHELRITLAEQFDAASRAFRDEGVKTLVVVDGLDHVERDNPTVDSLLNELPRPDSIPDGVVIIVGSRTLSPLHATARQQLEDSGRIIDLDHHRLPEQSVLSICARVDATRALDVRLHHRISQLAAGHPLSLGYLLNRAAQRESNEAFARDLESAITYDGDIAAEYRAIWDAISDPEVIEILAVVARLRTSFSSEDLLDWFSIGSVRAFQEQHGYLFRKQGPAWRIFHDSFRQFTTARTIPEASPRPDQPADAYYHTHIAALCASSTRDAMRWEELYHRRHAGEDLRPLVSQQTFRHQLIALRSPDLVREDLVLALDASAETQDPVTLVTALLAKVEMEARVDVLERVDVPRAFADADLVSEAVAFTGIDARRRVPLAQAHRLAARLGLIGHFAGRQIFDAIEHLEFEETGSLRYGGGDTDDLFEEWGRAAATFRPIDKLVSIVEPMIGQLHAPATDTWREASPFQQGVSLLEGMIDSLSALQRYEDLRAIDTLLTDSIALRREVAGSQNVTSEVADLNALRLDIVESRLGAAPDHEAARQLVGEALSLASGHPMYENSIVDWVTYALDFGFHDEATALFARIRVDPQLPPRALRDDRSGQAVDRRFAFWRARHRLAARGCLAARPSSAVPSDTLSDTSEEALSVADDDDLREAAHAIAVDSAAQTLGRIAAATDEGQPLELHELWRLVVPLLDIEAGLPPSLSTSPHLLGTRRVQVIELVADVVSSHSQRAAAQLAERFSIRFRDERDRWSPMLRVRLATELAGAGIIPDWLDEALSNAEDEALEFDVTGRVERVAELVPVHRDLGRIDDARRLARLLIPLSFGVGYRKDYQFTGWIKWLGRACDDGYPCAIEDAASVSRLLVAADPMTEGAPSEAAEDLVRTLGRTFPGPAVAIFEYLIRSGTVHHLSALASLLDGLMRGAVPEASTITMAGDVLTDVLGRAGTRAYPDAASAVIAAQRAALGEEAARELADRLGTRLDRYALPTSRTTWSRGLGIEVQGGTDNPELQEESTFDHLVLDAGEDLTRSEVIRRATDPTALISLRQSESPSSLFRWTPVCEQLPLTTSDIEILIQVFDGRTRRDDAVLLHLAQRQFDLGERASALRTIALALERSETNSWSTQWGSVRRQAHALAIAIGGANETARAWRDLAETAGADTWAAELLVDELHEVLDALQSPITASEIWPLIRTYLEGIGDTLELDEENPLTQQPIRWWADVQSSHVDRFASDDTADAALATLMVDHLSHPTWILHNAATDAVADGLISGSLHLAHALERIASSSAPDDVLEWVGRCISVARAANSDSPAVVALEDLEAIFASHPSQFVRNHAADPGDERSPLPLRYSLSLPPSGDAPIVGGRDLELGPYEPIVDELADLADIEGLSALAFSAIRNVGRDFPSDEQTRAAIQSAHLEIRYPSPFLLPARAVTGRILNDLRSAGLFDDLPNVTKRAIRDFDPAFVRRRPDARPQKIPDPPEAGHDQTLTRWITSLEERLNDYVRHFNDGDGFVVASTSRVTVLNWDHPEEECWSSTIVGTAPNHAVDFAQLSVNGALLEELGMPASPRRPTTLDPLTMRNWSLMFHQIETDWISFRPSIAGFLGWRPREGRPGCWDREDGQEALDTCWWVDGWWGHAGPVFDDTEADGIIVTATEAGYQDLLDRFGGLSRETRLRRWGRHGSRGTREREEAESSLVETFEPKP